MCVKLCRDRTVEVFYETEDGKRYELCPRHWALLAELTPDETKAHLAKFGKVVSCDGAATSAHTTRRTRRTGRPISSVPNVAHLRRESP